MNVLEKIIKWTGNWSIYPAMYALELKAKVKSGKEDELNQVIKDLIPKISCVPDYKTEFLFDEAAGLLQFKLSNSGSAEKIKEVMTSKNFELFIGSIKVLCQDYKLQFPKEKKK